jgi:SAM-dependent methyltransferase
MPTAVDHYRGDAGHRYHEEKRGIPEAAYPWVARLRAAKFAPHVGPQETVLEYGVGAGWNLAELRCGRRLGYDVAEFLGPLLARHGIEFVADTRSLADGAVEVVICHHTLEHLTQPAAALTEIHRLLRPAGQLLLCVPFEQGRRAKRYDPAEPNHHLYAWNVQTLANLVDSVGYQVIAAHVGRFGYDRLAAVWAHRLGLGEAGFRLIRRAIHLGRPGREVRVVARKPGAAEIAG